MSVRVEGTGDRLVNNGISMELDNFWIGGWFKCINLSAGESDVVALNSAETGAGSYLVLGLLADGSAWKYDTLAGDHDTGYNVTEDVWYYAVIQRSGATISLRLFDDSTSTTPLGTASSAGADDDLSAYTYIILGRCFTGQDYDGEVVAWRAVVGETLTDTQARAESQSYDYVLGGGTIYANWRLKDVDADDDGINDSSANSNHLTNTGCVAGASVPDQLSADATAPVLSSPTATATGSTTGSGSVSTDEGNGTLYWVVTTSATEPSVAQVQAGQDHTGSAAADSGSQAVSGTGVQNVSGGFTSLTAATTYYAHYQQQDAATNDSEVVASSSFTTTVYYVVTELTISPTVG